MTYPLQYFRLAIGDTDNNITASGTSLVPSHQTGKTNEKWYVNYIKTNVFQIINVSNNQLITASENNVSLANNSNSDSQNWKIEGVDKDYDGYYLYYKITNNADSSKSLTYTANQGFSLTKYSGINYQKFKLNLDGLEGFAANCKTASGEKGAEAEKNRWDHRYAAPGHLAGRHRRGSLDHRNDHQRAYISEYKNARANWTVCPCVFMPFYCTN
jgi:pectin lyase